MPSKHTLFPLKTAMICLLAGIGLSVLGLFLLSPWDLKFALDLTAWRDSAFGDFIQRWGKKPATPMILGAGVLLAIRSYRLAHPVLSRAAAAFAVQVLLHPALLTNGLKLLSGRPRPVHLGHGGEGFAPFWAWHPGLGDFSFPSGHVAMTMLVAPCVIVLWREGQRGAALGLGVFTAAWAGTVAFGRMAYGAHFATDVLFSIGLGLALAPLSIYAGDRALAWLNRKSKDA